MWKELVRESENWRRGLLYVLFASVRCLSLWVMCERGLGSLVCDKYWRGFFLMQRRFRNKWRVWKSGERIYKSEAKYIGILEGGVQWVLS